MRNKSIEFLLNHAGLVIQYRLRKEILGSITAQEEKRFLDEIYTLPHMQLIQKWSGLRSDILGSTAYF